MLYRIISRSLLFVVLLGLLVGCGELGLGSGGSSLSGIVTAPAGADVSGTTVFACFNDEPGCARLGQTTIYASGSSVSYQLGTLAQGTYSVYALSDANGDGVPNSGDYYGYFGLNSGAPILVSPPRANVDIEMLAFTGTTQLEALPETLRRAITRAP